MNNRIKVSNSNLNIASLYMSGSHVTLDDWKETLLIDGRPLAIPGANPGVRRAVGYMRGSHCGDTQHEV